MKVNANTEVLAEQYSLLNSRVLFINIFDFDTTFMLKYQALILLLISFSNKCGKIKWSLICLYLN